LNNWEEIHLEKNVSKNWGNCVHSIPTVLREVNITCTGKDVCNSRKKEMGYHKLTFSKSWVFHPRNRGDQGLSGKLFMLRLLEEMYKMGYDPIVSSDLVSRVDNSTVFFRKNSSAGVIVNCKHWMYGWE